MLVSAPIFMPKNPIKKSFKKLIEAYEQNVYCLKEGKKNFLEHPIYGTTLYIATFSLETEFGTFKCYTFQDIIHKGYVIALTYGKVQKEKLLYTRVHSSCVTSETLRGCDCDCAEQLEGALKLISEKGHGIFFYLMQEGRGVGYIAKARDRMLVQSSNDAISTFFAYELMGLKRDYRQYRNIGPILKMLDINAEFVLLTNNPDKVQKLLELGIRIKSTHNLAYKPSPYNLAYLTSKKESGHILKIGREDTRFRLHTPEPVLPFKPHSLLNAQRFIKMASYYLPIRPVENEVILNKKEFHYFFKNNSITQLIESKTAFIQNYEPIRNNRYRIKLNEKRIKEKFKNSPKEKLAQLVHIPYWFKIHLYFDIVTNEDFVVLTYGKPSAKDAPVIRLQSDSLANRFPLKVTDNRIKFCQTLRHILDYGSGAILLLYSDGRGAGFGAYAQDQMFTQKGLTSNTLESYNKLGINYDLRDYETALMLLKEHFPGNQVQMVMNSPSSLVKKTEYTEALNKINFDVKKWIFLE